MSRKAIALATMALFILFSAGCLTWGTKEIRTSADLPRRDKAILSVVKRSGEVIEFSRTAPARIAGNQVVGMTDVVRERDVEIEGPFPLIKKVEGRIAEVTDAEGRTWSVRKVLKQEPNMMTVRVAERVTGSVTIPLAEVWQVKIKRTNAALTVLAIFGVGAVAFVALAAYFITRD
jgi:hypothetical protein